MGTLLVLGQPPLLCFSIVGDTVASFLELFGLQAAGGVPTGMIAHYVIGPLFGTLFGVLVTAWRALRVSSVWKCILVAVVYVEILSQPILVTTPILLKMELQATLQWFAGSFVMHLIMSVMLGLTVGYGLRLTPLALRRQGAMKARMEFTPCTDGTFNLAALRL